MKKFLVSLGLGLALTAGVASADDIAWMHPGDQALVTSNWNDACNGTVVTITAIYANGAVAVRNDVCNGFEPASQLSLSISAFDVFVLGDRALVSTNDHDACHGTVVQITHLFTNGMAYVRNHRCAGFEPTFALSKRVE